MIRNEEIGKPNRNTIEQVFGKMSDYEWKFFCRGWKDEALSVPPKSIHDMGHSHFIQQTKNPKSLAQRRYSVGYCEAQAARHTLTAKDISDLEKEINQDH